MYDCAHCDRNPGIKAALGHDGPPTLYPSNLITGERFTLCPVRQFQLLRESEPELAVEIERWQATYFPLYREGHLLVAGGIHDQPARWLEAMQLIDSLRQSSEAKYHESNRNEGEG